MAIYMNFNSLKIKGEVTAEGHKDWIDLGSFQWGVGRGIGAPTGSTKDRESSAPSVSEITVSKSLDSASVLLLQEALTGKAVTVEIDFVKTGEGQLETYLKFTLTNTLISGYSMSSGGDRPSESLSLNFTKIEMKEMGSDEKGEGGQPASAGYDLSTAKKI